MKNKKLSIYLCIFLAVLTFGSIPFLLQIDSQEPHDFGEELFSTPTVDAVSFGIGGPSGPSVNPTPPGALNGVDYISYTVSYAPASHIEGLTYWDTDYRTLAVMSDISGTTLSVGQETYRKVVNKTAGVITDGLAVYVSGAQGNRPTVALASATTYTTAQAIGVATSDIAINSEGYVTVYGDVHGYDTRNFTAGDELWLAEDGGGVITNTQPITGCQVLIGTALNSTVNGTISVNPDWRCDRFGNIPAGDYADFENDGFLQLYGGARYWDDLRVSANATKINPATSKPDYSTFISNTKTFLFDPDSDEGVTFDLQFSHAYAHETPVEPHVHWAPTTADTGIVVWGLECTYAEISGTFGIPWVITTTQAGTGAYVHSYAELPEVSMTGIDTVSSMWSCYLYRDADASNDTYTGDAALIEFDVHFLADTLGSREEAEK